MLPDEKPIIIFDTDMDTDCDDVGALAMLLNAHLSNKIELAGIITDSVCEYAAPFCETMLRFYKVDLPIGAIYESDYKDSDLNISRFDNYRKHSKRFINANGYNHILSKSIQKTDRDYPSAVSTYRSLLTKAKDKSVTVLCVGLLTAVAETLMSPPDSISPLSGVQLFKQKVSRVIAMGAPNEPNCFNWGMDAYASERFFALCPTPVYISAEGTKIVTGEHLTTHLSDTHPLRRAYEIWLEKENLGRASWDLIAALYAIDPNHPYLKESNLGACNYIIDKKCLYTDKTENTQFKQISTNCEARIMVEALNEYMVGNF